MLKRQYLRPNKKKQEGMAVIEAIPVLFMLVLVLNFSLGFFGAIHSGILNSIGSYNYAFETFRYRSNLMYFRPGGEDKKHYSLSLNRVHGVVKDGSESEAGEERNKWAATIRDITFSSVKNANFNPKNYNASSESSRDYVGRDQGNNIWGVISTYLPTATPVQTPRIWIKTVYGICITADCTRDGQKDRNSE